MPGTGEKVVGGIGEEVVGRLIEAGGSRGHIRGGRWQTAEEYEFSLTPYEPEVLKFVAQEMLLEAGVSLMLHTYLIGAYRPGGPAHWDRGGQQVRPQHHLRQLLHRCNG